MNALCVAHGLAAAMGSLGCLINNTVGLACLYAYGVTKLFLYPVVCKNNRAAGCGGCNVFLIPIKLFFNSASLLPLTELARYWGAANTVPHHPAKVAQGCVVVCESELIINAAATAVQQFASSTWTVPLFMGLASIPPVHFACTAGGKTGCMACCRVHRPWVFGTPGTLP